MVRNIVLAVSTLAVLILLFVGYTLLVGEPGGGRTGHQAVGELPARETQITEPLLVGSGIEVPAGGKIMFRRFDERSGRPRDMFLCQDWQPVPGSKNEIRVTAPELAMLLPSGMIANISAEQGQISVDRLQESQMKPKLGWLAGNVKIVIDRETGLERSPAATRPEDLITIRVARLSFDLDVGELQTDERVTVQADDFEIAGSGLHLIWNQAENRIETLSIARGEEFVLYPAAGLFGMGPESTTAEPGQASASAPVAPARPQHRRRAPRAAVGYQCTLSGGLVAGQYRGEERVGGLEADEVHLLFDVGGTARLARPRPTTGAAARPPREERDRLVLRWTGSLRLGPAQETQADELNRRRFEALGRPVVLTRGDGTVRCGKVAYHDDTRQVWLYPTEGGTVEFSLGPSLSATAVSVFIDQAARLVKLIGDVELRSRRGAGASAQLSSIRSAYWAELHLAESAAATQPAATAALVDVQRLQAATFVGEVQVDLGEQDLTAHRLDVTFRPETAGQSFEESLESATASGGVELTSGDGRVTCARLGLAFAMSPEHELYPHAMDAGGDVLLSRKQSRVSGDEVRAALAPPPGGHQAGRAAFVLRSLSVLGRAALVDPDNKVAARGHQLAAEFEGASRLATARISGTAGDPALLHARPYTVRGAQIDLDRNAQTLHVDGPARLSLRTQRSLQGDRRSKPTPLVVTSERLLHVDGRRNTVRFEGQVVARSQEEQLQGDTVMLLLEDVPDQPQEPEARPPWQEAWRHMRWLMSAAEQPDGADELLGLALADDRERIRKEPVRLIADQALVTSETFEGDSDEPVVHASISAPHLEVDIVNRQIITSGVTELLMTDRRVVADAEAARQALGLPSALLSRGPSQSAMRCSGRMTYTLGPEGPERRDAVVFEDQVVFVQRTGREMIDLAQMLPQVTEKPELLETLKSRNASLDCDRLECWFAVDESDTVPRRGGALTRTPLRLAVLTAAGSVYMRDQQEAQLREVNAEWVEFNREAGRVHVRGAQGSEARVYFEDKQTSRFDVHAGKQLVINLRDGTIRSDRIEGEIRRP